MTSSNLEKTSQTTAVIGFIGALFFLVARITGNAIGGMSSGSSSMTAIILFFIGLAGLSVYVRARK